MNRIKWLLPAAAFRTINYSSPTYEKNKVTSQPDEGEIIYNIYKFI